MRLASCNAEFRMMSDLPPWLLALTGYGQLRRSVGRRQHVNARPREKILS
jgi:hypothetical protein